MTLELYLRFMDSTSGKMNYLAGPFNMIAIGDGQISGRFNDIPRIIAKWDCAAWYVDKAESSYREFKVQVQRHGMIE